MVIQAEGESGGREEKKAWGGIIVSEKPHLMAALCLGRGPEGQRTGLEVGLGLPSAPQDTRAANNHTCKSHGLKGPEFSILREGCQDPI